MNDPKYAYLEQLSVFLLQGPNHVEKTKTKENADISVDHLCESVNAMFKPSMFPHSLKLTTSHLYTKKVGKTQYTILPTLSKMFAQIFTFSESVFSKYQCRFCKGYSTQHGNLEMLEKWKKSFWQRISFCCFINRPLRGI